MEFRFNVSDIFKEPIVEINSNMLPPGFCGDRRAMWDAITRTTEVINAMGEASARAQGLSKPITTAERLRNAEHQKVYLLVDREAKNGKGVVTGMLKTGHKGLYIFDRDGNHYQCTPPCVLDFYVHESRQRSGLGKQLFENMLQREKIEPVKIAIDRPSDKFLSFLNKHYKLNSPVKQMNNFVVFDGFFPDSQNKDMNGENQSGSPAKTSTTPAKTIANGLQNYSLPLGRYGAPRPPCSMGQIIHNQSPTVAQAQESASSPGRLNQNPSYYTPPVPRQAFSSYATNVNSGVPNEIQMQYAQGDVQKNENAVLPAQNYQYIIPQQQQQQQIYNSLAPNIQPQYYQQNMPQQLQQQLQLQPQFVQQQPTTHFQTAPQYIQQPILQQQQLPMTPTQLPSTYQQQLQPQIAASAPHLYTSSQQYSQQPIPMVTTQPPVVTKELQPQVIASAPQLSTPQQQQQSLQQNQYYLTQQQIPHQTAVNVTSSHTPQQQQHQSLQQDQYYLSQQQNPPQTAVNITSSHTQQQQSPQQNQYYLSQQQNPPQTAVNVTPSHTQQQSAQQNQYYLSQQQNPPQTAVNVTSSPPVTLLYQSPIEMQSNSQSVPSTLTPQEFAIYNQNTQIRTPLGSNNDNQTVTPTPQTQATTPQYTVQTAAPTHSDLPVTSLQNNTIHYYTTPPQAGDVADQTRKYQYYDSTSNEMRSSPAQNIDAEGVAKKPSASGDRNEIIDKESRYELEYPPRTPESLGTPNRRRR